VADPRDWALLVEKPECGVNVHSSPVERNQGISSQIADLYAERK